MTTTTSKKKSRRWRENEIINKTTIAFDFSRRRKIKQQILSTHTANYNTLQQMKKMFFCSYMSMCIYYRALEYEQQKILNPIFAFD